MRLLDGINDTEDELYTFDSIVESKTTSKGLGALKRLIDNKVFISLGRMQGKKQFANDINIIGKELKALKIIKNKSVNAHNLIIYCFEVEAPYKEYVEKFNYCDNYFDLGKELLTQDEYNLLKEVLNNGL